MDKREVAELMEHVISSIQKEGQDPENQIEAYLITGNELYITKNGSARGYIKLLEKQDIEEYLTYYRRNVK